MFGQPLKGALSSYLSSRRALGIWARRRLKNFTKRLVRRSKPRPRSRQHSKGVKPTKPLLNKGLNFGRVIRPSANYVSILSVHGSKRASFSLRSPRRRRSRRKVKRLKLLPRRYITRGRANKLGYLSHQANLDFKKVKTKQYSLGVYKGINLLRLQNSSGYKQRTLITKAIYKKSLSSRSANSALRHTLTKKLRTKANLTQSYLRPKKIKRFTYRGVSSLSYHVLGKLPLASGGMQAKPLFTESRPGLQKQLAVLVFKKLFWLTANPVNLISTQYFLYQPAVNLRKGIQRRADSLLTHPTEQMTSISQHQYYGSLSAKLLRSNSTISTQELIKDLPTSANTHHCMHPTKGHTNLEPFKQVRNYTGDQFFYNSIQSYLVYRNSLKQHLATSKTASLILSFETRSTRLNTLPIFLELKRKPFGSDIKPASFLTHSAVLSNQARQHMSSFLNPMTLPSTAT